MGSGLPDSPGVADGAGLLLGLGLLQVGLSEEPLRVGAGLMAMIGGFEIGYTTVEAAIALHGLIIGVPVLIALVVAYCVSRRQGASTAGTPFALLAFTLALAIVVAVLRKERVAAWLLASGGAGLAAVFVFAIRPDVATGFLGLPIKIAGTWTIVGRALVLSEANRLVVGFVYLVAAFLFAGGRQAGKRLFTAQDC
jgi:hypothetical protein